MVLKGYIWKCRLSTMRTTLSYRLPMLTKIFRSDWSLVSLVVDYCYNKWMWKSPRCDDIKRKCCVFIVHIIAQFDISKINLHNGKMPITEKNNLLLFFFIKSFGARMRLLFGRKEIFAMETLFFRFIRVPWSTTGCCYWCKPRRQRPQVARRWWHSLFFNAWFNGNATVAKLCLFDISRM